METLIIHADKSKIKGLIEFLKAFNIPFERKKADESPYNPEFVDKIIKAKKEPGKRVSADNLWESIK